MMLAFSQSLDHFIFELEIDLADKYTIDLENEPFSSLI